MIVGVVIWSYVFSMKEELFNKLVDSIKEAGEITKGIRNLPGHSNLVISWKMVTVIGECLKRKYQWKRGKNKYMIITTEVRESLEREYKICSKTISFYRKQIKTLEKNTRWQHIHSWLSSKKVRSVTNRTFLTGTHFSNLYLVGRTPKMHFNLS